MNSQTIRAGMRQARADGRVSFLTPAFLGVVVSPLFLVIAVRFFLSDADYGGAIMEAGSWAIAGMIGVVGALAGFNVMSEMQTERTAGTLLRLRMMPNGTGAWVLGKLVVTFVYLMVTGGLTILIAMVMIPGIRPDSVSAYILLFGLLALSYVAFFPIGVIAGALVRSTWGFLISMGAFMLLYAGSGTMFPLEFYPDWLQWVIGVTPLYWMAHLGRWTLLPSEAGAAELTGSFEPLLGVAVIVLWTIVGFALVSRVLRSGMSRETVGSLMASRERVATKGYA
ncbi:MAG: ABC transporter permease [Ancrocorticia sp.]|uniref:ABC transporter permease n=1 Tax=Ancrocorticia sp. TaxID=2593684 RepID=UPI003F92E27D